MAAKAAVRAKEQHFGVLDSCLIEKLLFLLNYRLTDLISQ